MLALVPATLTIVTSVPLTYGTVLATVIIIGVAADTASMGVYCVPFGDQAKLPVPSVSRT